MAADAGTRAGDQAAELPRVEPLFWSIRDIQFNCRIGRTAAWQLVRQPDFPCPLAIGGKRLVWSRSEVLAFLDGLRRPDHYAARHHLDRAGTSQDFIVRQIRRNSERR